MTPAHVPLARTARLAAATAMFVTLLGSAFSQQANATGYQYLSPSPGARYVSPQNTVVFREGRELDPASLTPGLVSVVGAISGSHDGSLVVARDGRTLVFRPSIPFALGESVNVALQSGLRATDGSALPPVDFTFEVGRVTPRDQMAYLAGLPEYSGSEAGTEPEPIETNACSDLPTGFPPYNIRTYNNPDPGYLFLSPYSGFQSGNIAIIDNFGQPLFFQRFSNTIHDFSVQPNGLLTYFETAPASGMPKYFALDQTFALVDSFETGNGYVPDTHDLRILPNGNFVITAYDPQPVRMDLVVPGGRPDAIVIGHIIQELDPDRNVVFQWRSWDHMEITDYASQSGSLTAAEIDWVHGNAIDIMPDGNLLLCSRHLNEITKIDRQTGEILWRMGSHAKNNDFTFVNDTRGFSHQHDVRWLPNGHMTVFDNGNYLSPQYSRLVEYAVDEVNKTATLVMEYAHTPRIFTMFMGSARRLPSGKSLVGWGGAFSFAKLTEINPDGSVALELGAGVFVQSYRAVRSPWRGGLLVTGVDALDFGIANLGQTEVRPLQVRNGSSEEITISCATTSGAEFAVMTPLPLTLSPGGEATLDVAFTPSAAGNRSGKIYLRVPGAKQFVAQDVAVSGVGNAPPDCNQNFAMPASLWPPNHKLVPIAIQGVVDPEGDPFTITVTGITQDEPVNDTGDGATCPDGAIEDGAALVRAERSGEGDGRIYEIAFRAEDARGAVCTGTATVFVPHDQGQSPPDTREFGELKHHQADPMGEVSGGLGFEDALGPCPSLAGANDVEPMVSQPVAESWTLSLLSFEATGSRAFVEYTLAADGDAKLAVFDLSGRKVSTLLDGHQTAGPHRLEWNTSSLSPGVYFYRLRAGDASVSRIVRILR